MGNDHVKKLNNKIESFKILYEGFLQSHGCYGTRMLTPGGVPLSPKKLGQDFDDDDNGM